jgi:predicted lipoprotein with Yx(FWY)xxD motif
MFLATLERQGRLKGMRIPIVLAAAALLLGGAAVAQASESAGSTSPRPTLKIRSSQFGPILFSGTNRALYTFTRDRRNGPSRCYGDCAAAWPPYYAVGALRAAPGVKRSLIGTVRRRDGRRQVTYNGWPLYFYVNERPGVVRCQNVRTHGGVWLVQRASGKIVR